MYHDLSNIKTALEIYPAHKKTVEEIEDLLTQISSKKYRVAVIGEFNRGKSSLVNSLLGVEVLPTAILPTTAVISRIIYDTEQKMVVYFKDGNTQEYPLEYLNDFATKKDKAKEKIALGIRQIDVHYPSVFSRNGIELIDTPGLNEEEKMTETTLSVLEHIDTAIVVISAMMPLSLSEQNLICSLIEQKDIYHLTFVVSFIDKVSDNPEEQDEMVDYIAQRIKNETYAAFCKTHDDEFLQKKAEYILNNPKIFGLSAKQAMEGFIKNDNNLINASRFTHFKLELSAFLTASQEQDLNSKIQRVAKNVNDNFNTWHSEYVNQITDNLTALKQTFEQANHYINDSAAPYTSMFLEMENKLKLNGITYSRFSRLPNRVFLQCQSVILFNGNNMPIEEKRSKVDEILKNFEISVLELLTSELNNIAKYKFLELKQYDLDCEQFNNALSAWYCTNPFPSFHYQEGLFKVNSVRDILSAVTDAFQEYRNNIFEFCAEWRKFIFLQNKATHDFISENVAVLDSSIKTLNALLEKVTQQYAVNVQSVISSATGLINQ